MTYNSYQTNSKDLAGVQTTADESCLILPRVTIVISGKVVRIADKVWVLEVVS